MQRGDIGHQLQSAFGKAEPTELSVVVPMFNEADCVDRLVGSLNQVIDELADQFDIEVVLVDDASTDDTATLVSEAIAGRTAFRLVRHSVNGGIAAAIHTGLRESRHERVVSLDADGSYDPLLIREMVPRLADGVDLVVASPYHPAGGFEDVPAWRLGLSRAASSMYRQIAPQKLHCYTSCFRVYRRDAALAAKPTSKGFVGLAELLLKMQSNGATVVEHPAVLRARKDGYSKMKVGRVAAGHLKVMSAFAFKGMRQQSAVNGVRRRPK